MKENCRATENERRRRIKKKKKEELRHLDEAREGNEVTTNNNTDRIDPFMTLHIHSSLKRLVSTPKHVKIEIDLDTVNAISLSLSARQPPIQIRRCGLLTEISLCWAKLLRVNVINGEEKGCNVHTVRSASTPCRPCTGDGGLTSNQPCFLHLTIYQRQKQSTHTHTQK